MTATVRVLLVLSNGGPGGMQVQVGLLAAALGDAGCEVEVAVGPGDLDVGDVPVHRLPALTARGAAPFVRELRRVVAAVAPGVVHGHGLRLAPFLAGARRHGTLVTCHGLDPARARATAAMVRLARVPVAACGEGPRRLLARSGVHSRVLDNVAPPMPEPLPRDELLARFGLPAGRLVAVSPARLSPQKDPITLVRALSRCPGAAGVLVGGGPLEPEVRRVREELGVADRVAIAPWSDDARRALAGADVLVLASRWEGQPTVVLEAMGAGVAVVATSCVGTRDTVVDGVSGLLSPVGDAERLAASLERARDDGLRGALAAAARAQLADHAPGVVAEAHLDAYSRVLSGTWAG